MELWVRSQDKETLRLAEMLDIYELEDDEEKRFVIEESGVDIGCYKSKERALEVLDEIQSILCFKRLESYSGEGIINIENNTALYLMPKE